MDSLSVYRELADCYDKLGQDSMRDRFLMLAADAALQSAQSGEAERLRLRLLQGSRHHMLRPYNSFAEAVKAADVLTYLQDLRSNYPLDVARQLLESVQGTAELPRAAVDQTQQMSWGPVERAAKQTRAIPPTAPVLDMTAPLPSNIAGDFPREPRQATRPLSRPDTYPIREEQEPAVTRPLAQPLAGRATTARQSTAARSGPPATVPVPGNRPTVSTLPLAQPVAASVGRSSQPATRRPEPPYSVAPRREPFSSQENEAPPEGGAWFIMLLVGVVGTAAMALLVFTLARPFFPVGWLP